MNLPSRKENPSLRNISRVFVMGGTHGNERTGIHAVQYISRHAGEFKCGSVQQVEAFIGNPKAVERNNRYIDSDLNREFLYDYDSPLSRAEAESGVAQAAVYEKGRGLEIRSFLNALSCPVDFLLDLHTTTSNMGTCLIVSDSCAWTRHLCDRVIPKIEGGRVLHDPVPRNQDRMSSSLGVNQITLEVGPVQQGVADYSALQKTLEAVRIIIEEVDRLNGREVSAIPARETYTTAAFSVDYPRDEEGMTTALIHEQFMGKDFQPLVPGQPVFTTCEGKPVYLEKCRYFPEELIGQIGKGREIVPVFIGEAAYIEKGLAFLTAVKETDKRGADEPG